jgi:hypothetical protein
MLGAALVALPVDEQALSVDHLQPVHANVAHAGFGITRDHLRQRDEPAAVVGPAGEDRERVQRRGVLLDDLLHRSVPHTGGAHADRAERVQQTLTARQHPA